MPTDRKASRIKYALKYFLILSERLFTRAVDRFLNIDTVPPAEETGRFGDSSTPYKPAGTAIERLHDDSQLYASPNYLHLWRICRRLHAGPEDVFYDIGCGMGRMVCLMARRKTGRCMGIELFPSLCEIAERNAARLRGRRASIEILCGDAAVTDLPNGTIYFMFNPFGAATMKQVLSKIEASLSGSDRPVAIVYYNSIHADLIDSLGWVERVDGFRTFTGRSVIVWGNRLWQERKSSKRSAGRGLPRQA